MLDEALREFRRVADLRPTDASAPFYLGLIAAAAGPLGRGRGRRSGRRPTRRGPSRRRCTTWATRSSGSAGWTRPRPPTATRPARARDDARIMLGWSVVALKRGEHQVAQGRLARALELLGGKPAPALWYWAADARERGPRRRRGRAAGGARRASGAFPASPVLQNNLAVLLELSGRHGRRRDRAPGRAGRGPVAAPDLQEPGRHPLSQRPLRGRARGVRARRQAGPRSGRRPVLQARATSPTSGATSRLARESWSRATTLNPGHELARANLEMLDMAP